MNFTQLANKLVIDTEHYNIQLKPAPDACFLTDKHTGRLYGFVAGGDCCKDGQKDMVQTAEPWDVCGHEADGSIFAKSTMDSVLWGKKSFCARFSEDALEFWHEINGAGALDQIRFFRLSMGGCEFGFSADIDEVYNVAPNFLERQCFHPAETAIHDYGNDLSLHSGGIAIASVPQVFGLHDRRDKGYAVFSAFAEQGQYDWDSFIWNPEVTLPPTPYVGDCVKGGGFALDYYGKKAINGPWKSPSVCITFVDGEENVLASALEYAYGRNYLPRPATSHPGPAWWKEPIYCTWHDQEAMSQGAKVDYMTPKPHPSGYFCTQAIVDGWIKALEDHDCKPGTVVLDDKWQVSLSSAEPDTTKWPDIRKWIDECHKRGIRVFLWGMAWYREGIPEDECVTRNGEAICGDITNPKYEARLREMVRRYFSDAPDGLNADGLKLDGLLNLPTGAGLKNHKGIWGLELQKYLLSVIYDEAKKARKDVCISVFTANPYLDQYTDMVRLADMYSWRITTKRSMEIRANVYRATHPGVLIDTDGQLQFCAAPNYLDLLDTEASLGIPTIYNAKILRRGHFFFNPVLSELTEEDYARIAKVFREYRERLK